MEASNKCKESVTARPAKADIDAEPETKPKRKQRPSLDHTEPAPKRSYSFEKEELRKLLETARSTRELLSLPGVREILDSSAEGALLGMRMESYWAEDLPSAVKRWAFDLTRRNMEELYAKTWGWSNAEKRRELNHNEARFLVLTERSFPGRQEGDACEGSSDCQPVAFAHVRFVDEEGVPSLYLYELQLEPRVHRRGLGTVLMHVAERVGAVLGMRQSVLSVLKINHSAHTFYTQGMGYSIDWTSPDRDPSGGCHYFVLSKDILRA